MLIVIIEKQQWHSKQRVMLKNTNFFTKKFTNCWCGEWLLVNKKSDVMVSLNKRIMLEIQTFLQKIIKSADVMSDY